MIPGGVKADESNEACCIWELAEETGFLVKTLNCYLRINGYLKNTFFQATTISAKLSGRMS